MNEKIQEPRCKCDRVYEDVRHFKWGTRLLGNRIEFDVYVCKSCKCYWYDPSIPNRAKAYAFETFDWLPEGNRLPSPDKIRHARQTGRAPYPSVDVDALEKGEISNRHPLYYEFFAEHMKHEVDQRNQSIADLEREIADTQEAIAAHKAEILRLQTNRSIRTAQLRSLERKFIS